MGSFLLNWHTEREWRRGRNKDRQQKAVLGTQDQNLESQSSAGAETAKRHRWEQDRLCGKADFQEAQEKEGLISG